MTNSLSAPPRDHSSSRHRSSVTGAPPFASDARPVPSTPDRLVATVAAICFVLYPALRPASSETGLEGAAAFAAWQWTASHLLGVLAFVALAALTLRQSAASASRLAAWAAGVITLGVAAILPYYGAETFALAAIGANALETGDPAVMTLAEEVRGGGPALATFGAGLMALAVGGTLWALRSRRSDPPFAQLGTVLMALGLVTYLPQYYLPGGARIAHGALLAAGLLWWAWSRRAAGEQVVA